jgi:hypothetical protein
MLYCDTDSIIAAFKKDNYKNIINKQMGEVMFNTNENGTEIKDAVFCMPKTYGIKLYNDSETVKIKGFTKTPRFNELKESFYKKEIIETKNEQWHKKDFQIEIKNIIKHTNLNQLNKRS